jgi:hypothetical protein
MPVDSPPGSQSPLILEALPTPSLADDECPRRARIQLDLLLLAIEALDLSGSEVMLGISRELGLDPVIKGRVNLWLLRGTNPMRRYSQRRPMRLEEAKALVILTAHQSRRLTILMRQLLMGHQQLQQQQLSPITTCG